jgi:hypothetical protein
MAAMPRPGIDHEGFYVAPGSERYNIQLVGGGLIARATARHFEGMRPDQIEWAWMVDAKRRVTPEEIERLCAVKRA